MNNKLIEFLDEAGIKHRTLRDGTLDIDISNLGKLDIPTFHSAIQALYPTESEWQLKNIEL